MTFTPINNSTFLEFTGYGITTETQVEAAYGINDARPFNGNTGSITVECVDEGDALCRGKVNAVGTAVSSLSSVASQLANPDTPADAIDPLALHNAANNINATILSRTGSDVTKAEAISPMKVPAESQRGRMRSSTQHHSPSARRRRYSISPDPRTATSVPMRS